MHCPHIRQGLRINHDGNMVPCCVFTDKSDSFIQKEGLSGYHDSKWLHDLEQDIGRDIWPKGCSSCEAIEKIGGKSQRLNPPTGFSVEVVLGNVCNSDCGMCGPDRSSMIASRLKHHPHPQGLIDPIDDRFLIPTGDVEKFALDKLDGMLDTLAKADSIKLIGGEPFLIKDIWKTLDVLSSTNKDVKLELITNASILDTKQLEILERFNNLHLYISADAAGEHYEWIRHGLDWKTFEHNVLKLIPLAKYSVITATVSALNITGLRQLAEYAYGIDMYLQFWPISNPRLLTLENVSAKIIRDEIQAWQHIKPMDKRNDVCRKMLISHLQSVLRSCKEHNDPRLVDYIRYLNPLRKSDLDPTSLTVSNILVGNLRDR